VTTLPGVIDPRAIVDPDAILGDNVDIGPWSVVGEGVRIGDNTRVATHVVIQAGSHIGANCQIGPLAVIGTELLAPQRLSELADAASRVTLDDGSVVPAHTRVTGGAAVPDGDNSVDLGGR